MAMLVIARLGISNGYLSLVNPSWHWEIQENQWKPSRKTIKNIWGIVRFFPKP